MRDIRKVHTIVQKVLSENEGARKNDNSLIIGVLKEIGIDTKRPLTEILKDSNIPSFESITRTRRKIQKENPSLRDCTIAEYRAEQEKIYRDYARG